MDFIKNHKYFVLIIFFSSIPLFHFFNTSELIHTHDGLVHLPRLAAYFKALSEGNFPVRWAGYLNYGYGLPLFNFIYHVPYIIGSLFLFLGFSLVNAFKLSLVLSFIFSGVFMYLFGKEFFGDARKGFLVAIAYQFAPFHLGEILMRGSYGSVYAYAFLPLVLFALYKLIMKNSLLNFSLVSISTFLLIYSHNSLSLLFFGVASLFILFFAGSFRCYLRTFSALVFGLALSAFYWIPALTEHKYTYGDLYMKDIFMDHFAPLSHFFGFNLFNSTELMFESVNLNIGIFHILAVVITVSLLIRSKIHDQDKKIAFFALVIFVITFFFMSDWSAFIWGMDSASFLRQFQFPWRFMALIVLSTSLMFPSYLQFPQFKNKYSYAGLVMFIVLVTIFIWNPVEGKDKINEEYYWNFPLNTTYYGETDVIWSAGPAKSYPESRVEIISGEGEINNIRIGSEYIEFNTKAANELQILSNTQYFPGWRAYVDDSTVPIEFQDPNNRGLVTFKVPPGDHNILVNFEESPVRFFSNIISLLGLLLIIPFYYVIKKIFKE